MKTLFANPEIEVVKFAVADIITTSTTGSTENAMEEDEF